MLAHATVDGVAPPSYLLGTLRSALLAAATYRHPLVAKPAFSPGLSAIGSQEKGGEKVMDSHVITLSGVGPATLICRVSRIHRFAHLMFSMFVFSNLKQLRKFFLQFRPMFLGLSGTSD